MHFENDSIEEMKSVTGREGETIEPEDRGRTRLSFEKMGELIDKGLQIHAAIDAPTETKVLFKPLEMKYLSVSDGLKMLENKTVSGDEDDGEAE